MAEVPEVETIVGDLRLAVVGRTIMSVQVLNTEAVRFPPPPAFEDLLAGCTVLAAERRSKHILLPLDNDLLLAIHFMLWGTLLLRPLGSRRPAETLIVFTLDNQQELQFLDKLGYARAAAGPTAEVARRLDFAALGPDALDPAFTSAVLAQRLAGKRGALKTVLITPRVLSGLGNRDADESLWLAQIHPQRTPLSLAGEENARLYAAICQILHEGLELRGTQSDLFGRPGGAKHRRYVFERTGLPCPRCSALIEHIKLGGRNTHYCPICQPLELQSGKFF